MENVFKNKDLPRALKVMGELEVPIYVRDTAIALTIGGSRVSVFPNDPRSTLSSA